MTEESAHNQPDPPAESDGGPARVLTAHLLQMIETRVEAAGIALQAEVRSITARLQLRLLAVGALFLGLWAGIVLLAIVLPPDWRVPVLAVVVALFVAGAVWAQLAAKRQLPSRDVGSMSWFLEGLRLDVEVLSRSLANHRAASAAPPEQERSPPSDIAA